MSAGSLPIPEILVALMAALAAALFRWASSMRARRDREALADVGLMTRLVPGDHSRRAVLRVLLVAVAAGAIAAAGLSSWRIRRGADTKGAVETVIVLDASNSMRTPDVSPDRIAVQRRLAGAVAARLGGRMGVVFFAGRAYVLSPLTSDLDAVLMFVQSVDPSAVGRGGTAVAQALSQGLDVLVGGTARRRQVILFSDGESTAEGEDLESVLERASQSGIPIHAIGIGTEEGGRIPVRPPLRLASGEATGGTDERLEGPFLTDAEGEVVVSRLEEQELRRITSATAGLYVPGTAEGVAVLLRELRAAQREVARQARPPVLLLLLLAFGLLFTDAYVLRRG